MSVRVAASAGFCFGVDRAVGLVEQTVREGKRAVTLGPIIHNHHVVQHFAALGVREIASPEEVPGGSAVIIRSHGVSRAVYEALQARGLEIIDATCPFVSRIHRIVQEAEANGRQPLIIGTPEHPEVVAIAGWCRHPLVFPDGEALQKWLDNDPKRHDLPFTMVSQTTSTQFLWDSCKKIAKKVCTNLEFFDTICKATENRQAEAAACAVRRHDRGRRPEKFQHRASGAYLRRALPAGLPCGQRVRAGPAEASAGRNHWHHSRSFDACVDNKGGQPHYERNQYYR